MATTTVASTVTAVAQTLAPAMGSVDVADTVADLRKTFRSGTTRDVGWREEQLRQLARMVKEREEEFYDVVQKDLGRDKFDTFGEILMPAKSALDTAKLVRKWAQPQKVPTDPVNFPGRSEVVSEPYGVVLILAPWNFPFTTSLEPLIGAIAAGNAVLLKPSELAPHSSALLARLIPQYLDPAAIRVLEGGPEVAIALLELKWDKVFFTGGTEIGRKVAVAAAKQLTPVTLELGGKNPCYLDATADLPAVVKRLVYGAFTNAGQICLAPEYVLAEASVAPKLVELVKKTMEEFYGPDPSKSPDVARIISARHLDRLAGLLSEPRVKERVVAGGKWDRDTRYMAPTLLADVPWDTPIMAEETFGPILTIQTVSSLEEAIATINDRPKPLALYVFSKSEYVMSKIVNETSSGAVMSNDTIVHVCNPNLPFGGVGDSGIGAYHGKFSFDCFSHKKAVLRKGTGFDVPFRFPPSTDRKRALMRALMEFDIISVILILIGWKK